MAVSLCNLSSKIALACSSENLQRPFFVKLCLGSSISSINDLTSFAGHSFCINFSLASDGLFDDLISLIISSIFDTAIAKPTRIWALSLALFNKNFILLVTTSSLKSKKHSKSSFKFNVLGLPLSNATVLAPKDVCNWVYL